MIRNYDDTSIDSIVQYSSSFIDKSFSDVLSEKELDIISNEINQYKNNRKGHFGDLVEKYLFGIENNSDSAPDFSKVGVELKTTPLKKHPKKVYVAKERLVFSMINYMNIINEEWESSSFLKKNKLLLLMFYLYEKDIDLSTYEFKLIHLLDLLSETSKEDIAQIQQDWKTIVNKIKAGEAHLLSEGDTAYLGAATKASTSKSRRPQPNSDKPAKPRAFSLKQSYLNSLIQKYLGKEDRETFSLFDDKSLPKTIEENIHSRFAPYIGCTNTDIEKELEIFYEKRPKSHRRLLVNRILGTNSNKIEELEKADITLRVIALEPSGVLKESISFPKFDYLTIVDELWEESAFYEQLTTKRFLFVVFRKQKDGNAILEKIKFWNFPMKDIHEAQLVWEETVKRIKAHKADALPGIKDSPSVHVRPHARDSKDTIPTGYGTYEVKKSFWLNAKYIQKQLED
ncbi:Sau3AI family type II restriction endonuclease [Sulfurovum sp. XTW-4]|uniref:Sau3AI family type II restriction endonuclease n=1 Tax=Sulfurovum xiamenensis TaxID=3019066 RepID=A0ABT7QU08_9BACT|nr:Sau3AI family type II restriction endonuclease [Sulfurovum xiamenensis]MDM5264571.1 Sau3AI family type II restriction endonuclease [Sulfurovum xiamenensis]